ncbi:hypothetical protein N431DRAFT_523528, partial [Stipitochalara longipes BDJ]
ESGQRRRISYQVVPDPRVRNTERRSKIRRPFPITLMDESYFFIPWVAWLFGLLDFSFASIATIALLLHYNKFWVLSNLLSYYLYIFSPLAAWIFGLAYFWGASFVTILLLLWHFRFWFDQTGQPWLAFNMARNLLAKAWRSFTDLFARPNDCYHIKRCVCFDEMLGVVENNSTLDEENKSLRGQLSTLKTATDTIISQENRIRVAEATVQFCETHHQSLNDMEAVRQTLITRVSALERECNDLKRKYNRVANTNLDLHPLRMDQPSNLAEIVGDLRRENQNLGSDLDTARRVVPTIDLDTTNREINRLRTQEARCHLRARLETKQSEADAHGALLRELQQRIGDEDVVHQRVRADLRAAHNEIQKMRLAAQAKATARSIHPRLRRNETAYEVLKELCLLLEVGLRRVAALPDTSLIPRLVKMTPNDKQWLTAQHIREFMTLAFDLIPLLTSNESTATKQPVPEVDLDTIITKEPILLLGQRLRYALDGWKQRSPSSQQDKEIHDAFEEMIRFHYQVLQNDEGLRADIQRLASNIADTQSGRNTSVDCLQWTTALRKLNEQAVAALPNIGFDGKPTPAFGAADYIRDSVRYIQTLLNRIGDLDKEGEKMRDLIRTLGKEMNWRGSQLDWVASESGWKDAKYLAQAMATADDTIVHARILLDENGPNYTSEQTPAEKLPQLTPFAAPETCLSVAEAAIAVLLQIVSLCKLIGDCFGEDIEPEGDDYDVDIAHPISKDDLYKVAVVLWKLVDWLDHQDQSSLHDNARIGIRHLTKQAKITLVAAETPLLGYKPPARGVSDGASRLKFKNRYARSRRATGGLGGPSATHPPHTSGPNSRHRSASAPPSPIVNPASTAATQGMRAYPTPRPGAGAGPAFKAAQTNRSDPGWAPTTPPNPPNRAIPQRRSPIPDTGHIYNLGGSAISIRLGPVFPGGAVLPSPVSNPSPRHRQW